MTQPTAASTEDVNGPEPDLKRVLGPKLLLLFIVGDILGAGIYAVTGQMALEVGGIVWLPFAVAFAVATLTAFSYLELVAKYPEAAAYSPGDGEPWPFYQKLGFEPTGEIDDGEIVLRLALPAR